MNDVGGPSAGIRVRGGLTTADTEEMRRAAHALELAADHLDAADRRVTGLAGLVEEAAAWSPGTAISARAALGRLVGAHRRPSRRAEEARALAGGLRHAAQAYDDAESSVSTWVHSSLAARGAVLGEAGPLVWGPLVVGAGIALTGGALTLGGIYAAGDLSGRALGSRWLARTPAGMLARTPAGRAVLARLAGMPGPLGAFAAGATGRSPLPPVPARAVEPVVAGVAALTGSAARGRAGVPGATVPPVARTGDLGARAHGLATTGPTVLTTTPVVGMSRASDSNASPRLSGVLDQVAEAYPEVEGEAGTVAVQRRDHPDGTSGWVVAVPGTQAWSLPPGPNPADLTSNLGLMGGDVSDAGRTVLDAIEQAGIRPGEPVMLVGHSQGGIVTHAVAWELHRQGHTVPLAVTEGSPVGSWDLPPGTHGGHVEIGTDLVPALDGRPNPTTPARTTIEIDLHHAPEAELRAAAWSPITSHHATTYAEAMRWAEESGDPAIAELEALAAPVLGSGEAEVTTTHYTGTRLPVSKLGGGPPGGPGTAPPGGFSGAIPE